MKATVFIGFLFLVAMPTLFYGRFDPGRMTRKTDEGKNLTLTDLPIGRDACVTAVNGTGRVTQRLLEMGVIPGVAVQVVKMAPFGDPIEIRVRGYSLAMRRSEADAIEVSY